MTTLRGTRVTLRPFHRTEFDVFWSAVGSADPTVAIGSIDHDSLRDRVAASGTLTERELLFAIEAEGRLVGSIQGYRDHLPEGVFGIGIQVFEPEDRSRGFGREAVALLAEHLFGELAIRRLEAGTAADNAAMRRVLERLGFVPEGVLRRWFTSHDGEGADCVMYGMTRNDWENAKTTWTFRS